MNEGLVSNCKYVITFFFKGSNLFTFASFNSSHSFDFMLVFEDLFYMLSSHH